MVVIDDRPPPVGRFKRAMQREGVLLPRDESWNLDHNAYWTNERSLDVVVWRMRLGLMMMARCL
jgi:hypothetical protein